MKGDRLFKEINVWKPIDEKTMARYRCFEVIPDGKFFVKSEDYLYEDSDETYRKNLDDYFYESLDGEILNDLADEACDTIEEAIEKHLKDFEDLKVTKPI